MFNIIPCDEAVAEQEYVRTIVNVEQMTTDFTILFSKENMLEAAKEVAKKKSAGIDGISAKEARTYIEEHYSEIYNHLLNGDYRPDEVLLKHIPKEGKLSKTRPIAVATVVDRIIQKVINNAITQTLDEDMSENNYGFRKNHNCYMAVKRMVEYCEQGYRVIIKLDLSNCFNHLKSIRNKKYMIERHIIPFFGEKKMKDITPAEIVEWQNQMRAKGYAETYLRMIQNQITALFTHASNIYSLNNNPCKKVKKMGKADANRIDFWTKEEYDIFINTFNKEDKYYCLFEVLFWSGIRIGELLALTKNDIDFKNMQIKISKTYSRYDRKDDITTPKTEKSDRIVDIPEFLKEELENYINRLYKYPNDERIFLVGAKAVENMMKRHIEKAGVKRIRVHDLRHSHAAFLIHQGVVPLVIKERLGHKDIKITLNTYGHLYPNEQKKLAQMLNERK